MNPNKSDFDTSPSQIEGVRRLSSGFQRFFDRFIPAHHKMDAEDNRRANLLVGFGYLGAIFGFVFSIFYLCIEHYWGALIIIICSIGIAVLPFLLKKGLSLNWLANLLVLILIIGFTILCTLEGGLKGHAIAWIVSIPLCSLLLLSNQIMSYIWCGLSLLITLIFVRIDSVGIPLHPVYPSRWEITVSAAGYIALILFMFLLGIIFEINRKRAHQRMVETLNALGMVNKTLAELNQEKNEFLNMAAHDIKNPLGSVIGAAEIIRDFPQLDRAETVHQITTIIQAAKQMTELVTNILDVNAIEHGSMVLNFEPCSIDQLMHTVAQRNLSAAQRKGITLTFLKHHSSEIFVRSDPSALIQILDNFISNALKFSLPGTTVTLHSDRTETDGIIEIQDQGPGLSEEDQTKLFTKYSRLSAHPTGNESSHGLGLSIVKRISESMSGTVYCRSTPGNGSVFGIQLPLEKTSEIKE